MNRAVSAARLYVVNKWMLVWIPLIVLGTMVALTVAIRLIVIAVGDDSTVNYFNGAFQAVFWTILGVAVAASTQVFPFAFAMSLTRRDFVLGTILTAGAVAVTYATLYALLGLVEQLTDGFGLKAYCFDIMGWAEGPGRQFVFYVGAFFAFFLIGFAASMLWKRFSGKGLVSLGLVGAILLGAWATWTSLTSRWPDVLAWLAVQTPVTVGLYLLGLGAVLAGATFLMIRHAEP